MLDSFFNHISVYLFYIEGKNRQSLEPKYYLDTLQAKTVEKRRDKSIKGSAVPERGRK